MAHMHVALLTILLILLTFGNTINAGITRQLDQLLPMRERITRSILMVPVEDDTKSLETIPTEDIAYSKHQRLNRPARSVSANSYDLNTAENNIVFKPLFRKKPIRRVVRSTQNLDDLQISETNPVFKPLFKKNKKSNARIARSAPNPDDLQVSENNIVFKPLFRRRQNYRRLRRDASDDMQTAENNVASADDLDVSESHYVTYYEDQDASNDDNLHSDYSITAEDTDYNENDDEEAEETRFKRETQNADEILDTAANTIVFRPLFRNSRRNLYKGRN